MGQPDIAGCGVLRSAGGFSTSLFAPGAAAMGSPEIATKKNKELFVEDNGRADERTQRHKRSLDHAVGSAG
jgi:hypothetical protein